MDVADCQEVIDKPQVCKELYKAAMSIYDSKKTLISFLENPLPEIEDLPIITDK